MELLLNERPARKFYSGSQKFVLDVGQSLKIETAPHGLEILDFTSDSEQEYKIVIEIVLEATM